MRFWKWDFENEKHFPRSVSSFTTTKRLNIFWKDRLNEKKKRIFVLAWSFTLGYRQTTSKASNNNSKMTKTSIGMRDELTPGWQRRTGLNRNEGTVERNFFRHPLRALWVEEQLSFRGSALRWPPVFAGSLRNLIWLEQRCVVKVPPSAFEPSASFGTLPFVQSKVAISALRFSSFSPSVETVKFKSLFIRSVTILQIKLVYLLFSCSKDNRTSLMLFFTGSSLIFSFHHLTNVTMRSGKQLRIRRARTLNVAWLSISCQALSNFHSCFWLRNLCSARAIVSLAALWLPVMTIVRFLSCSCWKLSQIYWPDVRWYWTAASWQLSWAFLYSSRAS